MEVPVQLATDTTENWERSSTALGESELAIEIHTLPGGRRAKYLLVGDGQPVAPNVGRLRATAELIAGLPEEIAGIANAILEPALEGEARERQALSTALEEEGRARAEADDDLQAAFNAEAEDRINGDTDTLAAAKSYADEKVAAAVTASQKWLTPSDTLDELLLREISEEDAQKNLLCRVRGEQAVFQRMAGQTAWALYDDTNDYVNEGELAAAKQELQQGINAKAPSANAELTGAPTAPTAAQSVNNTQIATTAYVRGAVGTLSANVADSLNGKAPVSSPVFLGNPIIRDTYTGPNPNGCGTSNFTFDNPIAVAASTGVSGDLSLPVGAYIFCVDDLLTHSLPDRNANVAVKCSATLQKYHRGSGLLLSGTWKCCGGLEIQALSLVLYVCRRVA